MQLKRNINTAIIIVDFVSAFETLMQLFYYKSYVVGTFLGLISIILSILCYLLNKKPSIEKWVQTTFSGIRNDNSTAMAYFKILTSGYIILWLAFYIVFHFSDSFIVLALTLWGAPAIYISLALIITLLPEKGIFPYGNMLVAFICIPIIVPLLEDVFMGNLGFTFSDIIPYLFIVIFYVPIIIYSLHAKGKLD